jgi:hypothetical protein
MAYNIVLAQLSGTYTGASTPIYTYDLLAENGRFAFGELMNLRIEFTRTNNFTVGQRFLFNPCLFAPAAYAPSLPTQRGWVLQIVSTAGAWSFNSSLSLGGFVPEYLERNTRLTVSRITNQRLRIDFEFYATQDLFRYLQGTGLTNIELLQTSGIGQGITELSQPNVYSANAFLEFLLMEVNANLVPTPTAPDTDPYVRSPLNPTEKQFSRAVAGRFIDNDTLNSQAYSGTALIKNNLRNVTVDANLITKITEFSRQPFPVLSPINDVNLPPNIVDAEEKNRLMLDVPNAVEMVFSCPVSVPNRVLVHLLRVDDVALIGAQNFAQEYEIELAEIPASNATPFPNFINGSRISTPASYTIAGTVVTVKFIVDGSQLTPNAEYRIWAGLYNSAGRFVSSHLTPPMRANLKSPPTLTITGANRSAKGVYTGNDTVMTTLARHSPILVLDSSTYTGVSFANELKQVSFEVEYGGQIIAQGEYDFQAQTSTSTPQISLQVTGALYSFSFVDRLPFNNTGSNQTLTITWKVDLEYTEVTGSLQQLQYQFEQFVRVRTLNVSRITAVEFLDYTDWLASIETPVLQLCEDNNFVVVKVTKSGAPDANLIALVSIGAAQNSTNPPTIYEAESWISPVLLPQLSTPVIPTVEASFGDNFAYFVVDTRYLPANNLFNAVGAIIYDI